MHHTLLAFYVLALALWFTASITLKLPQHRDNVTTSTAITSIANLTFSESQLLKSTNTPTTMVGAPLCFESRMGGQSAYRDCLLAVTKIPSGTTSRIFYPAEFPIILYAGFCKITLTLEKEEVAVWEAVEAEAHLVLYYCHAQYPRSFRGAIGTAGRNDYIGIKFWYYT